MNSSRRTSQPLPWNRLLAATVGAVALTLTVTANAFAAAYNWNVGNGVFTTAGNWSPARTTPLATDVLKFNTGTTITVTGVTSQTIAQLFVNNNTNVTLQPNVTATVLNIGGDVGADLVVDTGSQLNVSTPTSLTLTISVLTGATGTIFGNMTFTGGTASTSHLLTAADASGITFSSPAVFTQGLLCGGNVFGSGTANSVVFASGTTFDQLAGNNPFQKAQPASVVVFQTGSLFKLEQASTPSFSGRTYGNFEYNASGTIGPTGGGTLSIDNLTIDQGIANIGMTGTFTLKGNISVATGAQLNFNPASGTPTVSLSGSSPQTITTTGSGVLGLTTANAKLDVNNSGNGVSLGSNVTVSGIGTLSFTNGKITTGANTLTIASTAALAGAGSGTGYVVGNLKRTIVISGGAGSRTWDIGDASRYTPVDVSTTTGGTNIDLTASTASGDHGNIGTSGIDASKSVNRTWTVKQTAGTFGTVSAVFHFDPLDVDGGANTSNFIVRKFDSPSTWTATTVGTRTATSTAASGITSFSDFQIGEALTWTLTPSAGANGSIAPSTPQTVNDGDSQLFTFTPNSGYHVADVKVDGSSVGSPSSYNFTSVNANHTIDVQFAINTYTISETHNAGGTVAPAGTSTFNDGDTPTYTFTPATNYHIADVKIDGLSIGTPGSYPFPAVHANHTVEVNFAIDTYSIVETHTAGGTVAPPGTATVNATDNQPYTFTPSTGYHIQDVKIDGSSIGTPGNYTFMNVLANHTVDVTFAINTYTIAETHTAGGTVAPAGTSTYNFGDNQLYTFTPSGGYLVFDVKIDGVSVGSPSSYPFNSISANHTVDVTFAANLHTITASVSPAAGGTITPSGNVNVADGSDQKFGISANSCYTLTDLKVDGVSVALTNSYTFTNVTADHTIEAIFTATGPYAITTSATPAAGGSVSGPASVPCGGDQKYSITANACYTLTDVKLDGVSLGAVTSVPLTNVQATHTIDAFFAAVGPFAITTSASPAAGGSVTGPATVDCGGDAKYSIAANTCYTLTDVKLDGVSQGPVTSVPLTNVQATHTIDAFFTLNGPYAVTTSSTPVAGGSVSGPATVACGGDAKYSISTNPCYVLSDVKLDGVSLGPVTSVPLTNVQTTHTIDAFYTINGPFTLTVSTTGSGSVSPTPDPSYPCGTKVTLTATPTTGNHFAGWSGDASGLTNPLSVVMDGNKSITANFLPNVYTWNQTGNQPWTTSTNWTPTRFSPSNTDVLIFNGGGSVVVNSVPTQTIAQLLISNSSTVNMQSSAAVTLTIAGGTGTDLDVPAGSTLGWGATAAANAITIALGSSATSTIGGTLTVGGAGAGTAHRLAALGSGAIHFQSGSLCAVQTLFSGNFFGNGTGTSALNSVVFEGGSVYSQVSGSNPFGAGQPNSVCTFQANSRYKLEAGATITPSFSGRTYADFECNTVAAPIQTTGGNPLKIDNVFITQGNMSMGMTGLWDIKGNITVNPGAQLHFNPAGGGTCNLSGTTTQTITVGAAGVFEVTNSTTLNINNTANAALGSDISIDGQLNFTAGLMVTGPNTVKCNNIGGAGTGWVDGNLKRTLTPVSGEASTDWAVGDATNYTPINFAIHSLAGAVDVTGRTDAGDHTNISGAQLDPSKTANRTWSLNPASAPTFSTYDATFNFVAGDLDGGANTAAFVVRRYSSGVWHSTTTGTRTGTSTQATGVNAFSDYQLGDPTVPTLSINDVSQLEAAGPETFTVTLSFASIDPVTVQYATANGTATLANNDYVAATGTLTFNPGETTKPIAVTINDDATNESDETYVVNLTTPVGATIADGQGQGTIQNDDNASTISIADVTKLEGNGFGATTFGFVISLSNPTDHAVTVQYATANGSATAANNDYVPASGTATIAAKTSSTTVNITVIADQTEESDENFFVNLTSPVGATIADAQAVGTIQNDDGVPSISINDVSDTEGNVGLKNFTFTVSLSNPSDQPITMKYQTANGSATAPSDYVAVPLTTLTIPPKTILVTVDIKVKGDITNEPNETFFVNLSAPSGATIADAQGQGTIVNDDDTQNPNASVLMPNGGEINVIGTVAKLAWSATDNAGVTGVDLLLSRSGVGGPYETIALGVSNSGTFLWTVTGPASSHAILKVVAHDAAGNSGSDVSDNEWTIEEPTATLLSRFEADPSEEGVTVRWEFADRAGVTNVSLERSEGSSSVWTAVAAEIGHDGASTVAVDRSVESNKTYSYRLNGMLNGHAVTFGPVIATTGELVHEFALAGVSPNPATGPATVTYAAAKASHVRLSVVDVQGRVVATLVDGLVSAGKHQVVWNGETARGTAKAGVYFVRFEANGKSSAKRFMLAR